MITGDQLRQFLIDSFNCVPEIVDAEYSLPTKEWLLGDLCDAFRQTAQSLGLWYTPESEDCDKFSVYQFWCCLTTLVLAKKRDGDLNPGRSLAVGVMLYTTRTGGRHCIVLGVVRNAQQALELVFIEPQLQQSADLTNEEKNSVDFAWM